MNGKETPKKSFETFTGHIFLRLRTSGLICINMLLNKKIGIISFGKRDSLAGLLTDLIMAGEKLDYKLNTENS